MGSMSLPKSWATLAGVVLVLIGLLGFVENPIVGTAEGALVPANALHNIVHLATGVIALWIAFGLRGVQQANALAAFGVLYLVVLVATIISPELFGLFAGYGANAVEHVIHGVLGIVSLGVGWMGRSSAAMA